MKAMALLLISALAFGCEKREEPAVEERSTPSLVTTPPKGEPTFAKSPDPATKPNR